MVGMVLSLFWLGKNLLCAAHTFSSCYASFLTSHFVLLEANSLLFKDWLRGTNIFSIMVKCHQPNLWSETCSVTRLGEISPFGRFFLLVGAIFSAKIRPRKWRFFGRHFVVLNIIINFSIFSQFSKHPSRILHHLSLWQVVFQQEYPSLPVKTTVLCCRPLCESKPGVLEYSL